MSGALANAVSFCRIMQGLIGRSRAVNGATKTRDARDGRGGLRRHGYCSSLFAGHSKMGMLVLLNGAIVSHNPGQSPINSMGDTAARADP